MTIPLQHHSRVLLLVIANGFFVAAEYALVTARRSRLPELADGGAAERARIAFASWTSPLRFIGTVQLGITAFSILLGAVGEPIVAEVFDPRLAATVAFVLALLFVTYLHVVIGELVPKAIALATRSRPRSGWRCRSKASTSSPSRSSGSCRSRPTS